MCFPTDQSSYSEDLTLRIKTFDLHTGFYTRENKKFM